MEKMAGSKKIGLGVAAGLGLAVLITLLLLNRIQPYCPVCGGRLHKVVTTCKKCGMKVTV